MRAGGLFLPRTLRVLCPPSPLAPGRRRTVEVSPSLKALPRLMSASWRCMSNSTFDLFSMYLETLGIAGGSTAVPWSRVKGQRKQPQSGGVEVTKVVVQQAVMVAEEVVVEAKAARTAGAAVAPKPMTADLIDWRQTASLWNGSAKRGRRMYAERSAMLAMQPRMKKASTTPSVT